MELTNADPLHQFYSTTLSLGILISLHTGIRIINVIIVITNLPFFSTLKSSNLCTVELESVVSANCVVHYLSRKAGRFECQQARF